MLASWMDGIGRNGGQGFVGLGLGLGLWILSCVLSGWGDG